MWTTITLQVSMHVIVHYSHLDILCNHYFSNSYDQYQKCLRSNTPSHIYSIPGGEIPSYGDRVAFYCQRLASPVSL